MYCKKGCDKFFMAASLVAVGLAAIGFLWGDVWLASTQWLLVALILGVYGLWCKLEK